MLVHYCKPGFKRRFVCQFDTVATTCGSIELSLSDTYDKHIFCKYKENISKIE